MYSVYSLLYALAIFFLVIPQYLKRPKELRRKWVREKLGLLPQMSSSLWVHAVSVGEVNAALRLLRRLREKHPHIPLLLSTITDTGQKIAADKAPEGVSVVYLPFDITWVLSQAFRRTNPRALVVIETELWPNIFRIASKKNVPVLIVNGRISEKSSQGYRKISFFMKKVFSHVTVFSMQSRLDAERLRLIGAEENRVQVSGNFKFDMEIRGNVPEWACPFKGPVIVAGSTHEGEEALILSAYLKNLVTFPALRLILAPRHPERFQEVAALLTARNVNFVRRSELGRQHGSENPFSRNVLLLDSMGELSAVFGIADIAIIGKSFFGTGGQNPLEPAYWGKPIICGPHMENFPFIEEFHEQGAAFETGPTSLAQTIGTLLLNPDLARTAGEKARALFVSKSGAVEKAIGIIEAHTDLA